MLKLDKTSIAAGNKLRKHFEAYVTKVLSKQPQKVALLLSAGVDSTAVGICAHSLGHKIHAYTFQLGDHPTFDSKWAEKTAQTMGWKFTLIKLPLDADAIISKWPILYNQLQCQKKVHYECAWPMLLTYPYIKEKFVLNGLHADAYFGNSRKARKLGEGGPGSSKKLLDARRKLLFVPYLKKKDASLSIDYNPSCMLQNHILQKKYKKIDVNPFMDANVYNHFMQYSWDQLNKPRQKHHLPGMYPMLFQYVGFRNHVNYQLGANIDHHFEKMLLPSIINFKKRRRAIDMYQDWKRYPEECKAVLAKIKTARSAKARKETKHGQRLC